jgi:hypothetical protein
LKPISLILIFVLLATIVTPVKGVSLDVVRSELVRAFVEVQKAEQDGADVSLLAPKLEAAAVLLNEGGEDNISRALALILEVRIAVPTAVTLGNQYAYNRSIITIISVATLGILGALILVYGSKFYWGLWLRIRGGWRVERS